MEKGRRRLMVVLDGWVGRVDQARTLEASGGSDSPRCGRSGDPQWRSRGRGDWVAGLREGLLDGEVDLMGEQPSRGWVGRVPMSELVAEDEEEQRANQAGPVTRLGQVGEEGAHERLIASG